KDDDLRETLEETTYRSFCDHTDGTVQANFALYYPHDEPPVAMVAHIRCIINGKQHPFLTTTNVTSMFFAAAQPHLQADIEDLPLDFDPVDTVSFCQKEPLYKRSFFMG